MSGTSSVYHPMLDNLTARLAKIVKQIRGEARLTEANIQDALREVRVALLEADVALPVVKHFIEAVRASALGEEVIGSLTPGQALVGLVHRELARLMGGANVGLDLATQPPAVILMAGLQGSGKTTTAGKLAKLLAADKKKVALVSCDVYRPAAIEQLKAVAAQAGADFVESKVGESPVDIATRARARKDPLLRRADRRHCRTAGDRRGDDARDRRAARRAQAGGNAVHRRRHAGPGRG